MLWISFLHMLVGTSILGMVLFSFASIIVPVKKQDKTTALYALRHSFILDIFLVPLILVQMWTSGIMMHWHHLSMHVPWVLMANIAFGAVVLCLIVNTLVKRGLLMCLKNRAIFSSGYTWLFVIINIVIAFLFFMIIHDAVTKQTLLPVTQYLL